MLSIIVAMDKNNLIGNHNALPWHLSADLQYFKKMTIGKTIVMGRKTFESIGKPLPNRTNIVITRDKNFTAQGCQIIFNIDEVIKQHSKQELMIIGGRSIYKQTIDLADKLYITRIDDIFEGNVYFPKFDENQYQQTQNIANNADMNNKFKYNFIIFNKLP